MDRYQFNNLRSKFRRLKAQKGVCFCPECSRCAMSVGIMRLVKMAGDHADQRTPPETDSSMTLVFKAPGAVQPPKPTPLKGGGHKVH